MANKTAPKPETDTNGQANRAAAHLEALETKQSAKGNAIVIPKLDIRTASVGIVGDSGLIVHRWSEKAIKELLGKQMGTANEGKEKKDPDRDYHDSMYVLPDGRYGFPSIAFKNAAVTACTSLGKSVTKVMARQAFHVMGEFVVIEGKPVSRRDMVRLNGQTADVRYRAEFFPWSTTLTIRYNARVLTVEQIVNMLNTAGFAVGVGEWRSERDGSFGMFHVA